MLSRILTSNYISRRVLHINPNRNIYQGCARLEKSSEKSKGGLLSRIKNVINKSDNELSERSPLFLRSLWASYSWAYNLKNYKVTPIITSNIDQRSDNSTAVDKRNYCDSRHISKPPIREPNVPEKSDKKDKNSEKKKVKKPVIYVKNDTIPSRTNIPEEINQKSKESENKKVEKPVIRVKVQSQTNIPEKINQKAKNNEKKRVAKPVISVKDEKIQPQINIAETSHEKDEETKRKKLERLVIYIKNDSNQPKSYQKPSSEPVQVNRNKWRVKLDQIDSENKVIRTPTVTTENKVEKLAPEEEKIFYPTTVNKSKSVMATLVSREVNNVPSAVVERPKKSKKSTENDRIYRVKRRDLDKNESAVAATDNSDHVKELAAWKEAIQKSTGRGSHNKLVIPSRLEDVDTVFIRPEPPKRN